MSPEHRKLSELFSGALAITSPAERDHFLREQCGGDATLRAQIDSLLEAEGQSGDFLRGSVLGKEAEAMGDGPGSVLDRYKLLQRIGEGGFGLVYMAEQQQPVRRMVAVKIIKAGMETREVLARFEAERQALALMDHPNIARVLDGGTTSRGRPYFVMDLVKGVPITEFCELCKLPTEERLRLFLRVCAGVQHAHQKGVIHRDLKPSNVLVTAINGEPVPKIIDFGVAKAISRKLTDRTLFTRFEQLIGTPAYMSPEQAEWGGVDIDTRSDLYSLGVLLYELLTGTTPLEQETLARAPLDEVRRRIREEEPPKPSTRLTAMLGRAACGPAGQKAPLGSSSWNDRLKAIRGDLDWIVMKALEKDRTRRYETVNGLARDIERHINGEPVTARPPSKAYLAGKFVRKHRVGVGAMACVVLALVGGFARARTERRLAKQEAATAKAISDFLANDLLAQASPELTTNRNITVREVLDRAAKKIEGRFTTEPLVEASIRATLGHTYLLLDDPAMAQSQLERAVRIRTQISGAKDASTLEASLQLAQTCLELGEDPTDLLTNVARTCETSLGADAPLTLEAQSALNEFFLVVRREGLADSAIRNLVARMQRIKGPNDPDTLQAMNQLGEVYRLAGRPEDALVLDQEALDRGRRSLGPSWRLATLSHNLAIDYCAKGEYAQAVELLEQVVELNRGFLGPQHISTKISMGNLESAAGAIGDWGRCLDLSRWLLPGDNQWRRWAESTYRGAVAALLEGNQQAFDEFAEALLARFKKTENRVRARMVVEVCFLTSRAIPHIQDAFELSNLLPDDDQTIWYYGQIAKGMAEYRRGDLDSALQWFEKPRNCGWSPAACQAGSFYAMILYRQANIGAAREALAQAGQRLGAYLASGELGGPDDKIFWRDSGPSGIYLRNRELLNNWHEYGRAAISLAEAEQLVLGHTVSPLANRDSLQKARQAWNPVRQHLLEAGRLAGRKEWARARAEYVAALARPEFDWNTAEAVELFLMDKMGAVFLLSRDVDRFNRLCSEDLARLAKYPDGVNSFCLAKVCLTRDLPLTDPLQRHALEQSNKAQFDPGPLAVLRAMAAYRLGRFEEVGAQAKEALQDGSIADRGAARIFCAMAAARMGRESEGKRELEAAEKELAPHLANLTGDTWWNLALCQLVLDEAHKLFGR